MAFGNNPRMTADGKVAQHTHAPITVDHFGTKISIKENGKVEIAATSGHNRELGVVEVTTLTVSAAVIFKAASLLKLTRSTTYVDPAELRKSGQPESKES